MFIAYGHIDDYPLYSAVRKMKIFLVAEEIKKNAEMIKTSFSPGLAKKQKEGTLM